MGNWQPIETAPKDGTEVLMWSETMGMAVWPSTAKWDHVTHWMPLPQPPQADKAKAALDAGRHD